MDRIFSTILVSALIEFVSEFLPVRESGSAKKYLRYITSLIIAISIISPVMDFISSESRNGFFKKSELWATNDAYALPHYIYVTDSGVYEANAVGEKLTDEKIPLNLYIKECTDNISDSVKELLSDKFSLKKEDISIDISLDVTDYESIEIISVRLWLENANGYIKKDACDYISANLDCKTYAE